MKKLLMGLCVLMCLLLAGCDGLEATEMLQPTEAPVQATAVPTEEPTAAPTQEPAEAEPTAAPAQEPAEATATPEPAAVPAGPAAAYLVVRVSDTVFEPIPLRGSERYVVQRGDLVNIIEVTEDSIWMDESSCDNQDCIYQGVVTLENREQRVLQNMIICLPNEVMLELYTYEELQTALPGWAEGQE